MPRNLNLFRLNLDTENDLVDDSGTNVPTETPPPTPQENNPAGPPAWIIALNAANDARRQAEDQARIAQEALKRQPEPPLPKLEEGEVFNNPNKFINTIDALIDRQLRPLREGLAETQRRDAYSALKSKFLQYNPQVAAGFRNIESFVDAEMQGKEPTESNLIQAIHISVGKLVLTQPQLFTNNQNPPPQNTPIPPTNVNPPHLRPTSAPMPSNRNAPREITLADFDENERRLIRESGYTPAEWVKLRDANPNDLERVYKEIAAGRKGGK